jgi:hypothetical protein
MSVVLERLEDRLAPATLAVGTFADAVVPGDGVFSLREAVSRANALPGPDTIVLRPGVYRLTLAGANEDANATGDLDVTGPVTIQGQGASLTVIDGVRLDRLFDVHGKFGVSFSGLTLRNGRAGDGGGAAQAADANLKLVGCVVTGNSGLLGGGINAEHGDVTLIRTTVSRNVARGDGGGVRAGAGSVSLTNSAVLRNNALGNGGGVFARRVTAVGGVIAGNTASETDGGGGIRAEAVALATTKVLNNIATRGGGILATASASLTACDVSGNYAPGVGGGVLAVATVNVVRSTLRGNRSAAGGAIFAGGAATVTGSGFSDNEAGGDGGGLLANSATVSGCVFDHNSCGLGAGIAAGGDGGAICVRTKVTVTNSTISRNAANGRGVSSKGNGGGLFADAATVSSCVINQNFAGNGTLNGNGGGVFATTSAAVTGCTIAGNVAVGDGAANGNGGGINGGAVTVVRSTIRGNSAHGRGGGDGGGIFARSGATVIGSTVSGNLSATVSGAGAGGIRAAAATVTTSTVSGNAGGGLLTTGVATVVSSTVSSNMGTGIEADEAFLTNCTISGNHGLHGGGIHLPRPDLTSLIVNCTIADNFADLGGGGVFLGPAPGHEVQVRNSIIARNAVGPAGSGMDVSGTFSSIGHNFIGDPTGSTGFTDGVNGDRVGTAANPLDPRLGPLAFNGGPTMTHALLAGSPAIDRGDNAGAPGIDQRGARRPRDGDGNRSLVVDIGAFER